MQDSTRTWKLCKHASIGFTLGIFNHLFLSKRLEVADHLFRLSTLILNRHSPTVTLECKTVDSSRTITRGRGITKGVSTCHTDNIVT